MMYRSHRKKQILVVLAVCVVGFVCYQYGIIAAHTQSIDRALSRPSKEEAESRMTDDGKDEIEATTTLKSVAVADDCEAPSRPSSWSDYYDLIEEQQPCAVMRMFGGARGSPIHDGAKFVCMDLLAAPAANSQCLVLSFGINYEFSFDDAMAATGCQVHAFDPVMRASDHQRGARIFFHSLGLSASKGSMLIGKKHFPVDSYRGILEHINHLDSIIDYLKIDIEGSEIAFFENVLNEDQELLKNVKQIGMEVHQERNETIRDKLWDYIHRLRCLGFRQVSSEMNTYGNNSYILDNRKVSCCYELVWVNSAYY